MVKELIIVFVVKYWKEWFLPLSFVFLAVLLLIKMPGKYPADFDLSLLCVVLVSIISPIIQMIVGLCNRGLIRKKILIIIDSILILAGFIEIFFGQFIVVHVLNRGMVKYTMDRGPQVNVATVAAASIVVVSMVLWSIHELEFNSNKIKRI